MNSRNPLQINIRHLEEKDIHLQGELPVAKLELDMADELIHPGPPLRFDLTIQKVGEGILVSGQVELKVACECSRCLKQFDFDIKLVNWTAHLPLSGPEKVVTKEEALDLTPIIREDILLEYPQHPLCENDCAGLPNRIDESAQTAKKAGATQKASVWSELNKLKFK